MHVERRRIYLNWITPGFWWITLFIWHYICPATLRQSKQIIFFLVFPFSHFTLPLTHKYTCTAYMSILNVYITLLSQKQWWWKLPLWWLRGFLGFKSSPFHIIISMISQFQIFSLSFPFPQFLGGQYTAIIV